MSSSIYNIALDVTLIRGRKLFANDSGGLFSRKKTSDPYAIIYWGGEEYARTKTIDNTLNPEWNGTFKIKLSTKSLQQLLNGDPKYHAIDIVIFDNDKMSKDDALGTVTIPLKFGDKPTNLPATWYTLGKGKAPYIAKDVSGDIEVKLAVSVDRQVSNAKEKGGQILQPNKILTAFNDIQIEIGIIQGRNLTAKDSKGVLSTKKTSDPYAMIYWGGNERGRTKTIDDSLNPKWNETFKFKVGSKIMQQVLSRDPKYSTIDIVVFDEDRGSKDDPLGTICIPTNFADFRMEQTFPANWYTLGKGTAPYIAKDISGDIQFKYKVTIDKVTTNAMHIGEPMKLRPDLYGNILTLNLGWSGTLEQKVKEIDAHASAICFDEALNLVDIASFSDTKTRDGSIIHCGTGKNWFSKIGLKEDTVNLGENITIKLDHVNPSTSFICFVINSYKGRNIDKHLSKYEFTLHDENTKTVITDYKYSKPTCIGKHSALLMCCLYRYKQPANSNWMLRTLIQATPGIITNQVVDVLQNVIHHTISPTSFPSQRVPTKHSSGPRASLVVEC